jgi:hypothetical protein
MSGRLIGNQFDQAVVHLAGGLKLTQTDESKGQICEPLGILRVHRASGFELVDCFDFVDSRVLSRSDSRTQPGVLTPGAYKNALPRRAVEAMPQVCKTLIKRAVDQNCLPPLSSFVPHSRNYGGQAGRVVSCAFPGG